MPTVFDRFAQQLTKGGEGSGVVGHTTPKQAEEAKTAQEHQKAFNYHLQAAKQFKEKEAEEDRQDARERQRAINRGEVKKAEPKMRAEEYKWRVKS